MTLSRLVLTLGLTAMLATPALARHGDDDDDDRRSQYSDDDSHRHGSGRHDDDDDDDRDHCTTAPRSSWLSISRIEAQARSMGYTVTKIERKGSCYEVYARKDGTRHELYFDPATARVVRREDD
jgi:ABC-type Zn2+ transport system substrate-binding protein/surface adhesin